MQLNTISAYKCAGNYDFVFFFKLLPVFYLPGAVMDKDWK